MPKWKNIKNALEWVHLGKVVVDIALAFGSLQLVKAVLNRLTNLSSDWVSVIAIFTFAFVLLILIRFHSVKIKPTAQASAQNATNTLIAGNFDASAYFATAYVSLMKAEVENNVRTAAAQNRPNDREGFYVELIGTGLPSFMHEFTWAYIFKSQLLLLNDLNRAQVPIAKAKEYYEKAATENPKQYSNYSFTNWLEFMKTHVLIIIHTNNGMIEGTVRGRDFLKYLVHWGRSAEERRY